MTQQEKKERLSLVLKTIMHWKRSSRSPSIPLQVAYPTVVSPAILISCWIMWNTSAADTNCTISNLWVHFYTLVLPMVWRHTIVYTRSKLLNWNCSSNSDLQTDSKKQQWENLEISVEECFCTRESCQQFTNMRMSSEPYPAIAPWQNLVSLETSKTQLWSPCWWVVWKKFAGQQHIMR
jgi:hypothetical protein